MKFLKRIAVFVFIGFLCFNSVFFSYEKAYSSDAAVAPALPLAYEALVDLLTLLGATAVVGCTWECLDSLDENSTPEEWKKAYNKEKELYDNFKSYYIENEGSENLYITDASGQVCYLDDILENDFPDEEEFKELKKKSNNKKYDPTDWWQYADDLLDLLSGFFNDEDDDDVGSSAGDFTPQYYFTGDEGYINRETGDLFIHLNSSMNGSVRNDTEKTTDYYEDLYLHNHDEVVDSQFKETYRAAVYLNTVNINYNTYSYNDVGSFTYKPYRRLSQALVIFSKLGSNVGLDGGMQTSSGSERLYNSSTKEYANYIIPDDKTSYIQVYYSCKFENVNDATSYDVTKWDYLSSNLPIFATRDEAVNYIVSGDVSSALNLPPSVSPTPVPDNPDATNTTAVSTYCNSLKGKWVNSTTINNFVENLTTYIEENNITPDNTDPDYVDAVNSVANNVYSATPTPTNVPYKGYEEDAENDGDGFSLWKFFEWLLDFFTIDMDLISSSIKVDFIPAASFKSLVDSFNKMKVAFGSDTYMNVQSDNELTVVDSVSINSSGTLIADYPVISCKVPQVLSKYLAVDGDVIKMTEGEKVIILCDFADYAVYFARFRAFLIAVMWIGMLFYLMREFQVTFNIS